MTGRKQVVVSASREVVGYDLETGRRIWWARGLGQNTNTIPQPVASDALVFAMSGFRNPNLMAIRSGREGDLTDTDAIVWQNQRGNSYTASPVLHDDILYVLTDSGMLSAVDAKTPAIVDGGIYLRGQSTLFAMVTAQGSGLRA